MKYENDKLRQMLAAEYVLGTLSGSARRRFEKLARDDAGLRDEITYWETRFCEYAGDLAPVTPPQTVWLGLQHRVNAAPEKVTPIRRATGDGATAKPVSLWRIAAGLATAAAIVVAVLIGQRTPAPGAPEIVANTPPPTAPLAPAPAAQPVYVALLKIPNATMQWTLSVAPEHGLIRAAASGEYARLGKHSLELWVITANGPVPLGLLPVSGSGTMKMPADIVPGDTLTLAVSLEPVGGSPTGKPTGPVLTSGAAVKVA